MTELQQQLQAIFAERDRANMQPTIDAFLAILSGHPDDPEVLYEVGGSYDTDGQEAIAAGYYERAIAAGLGSESLRKCYLQYGSTLRNLGRADESLEVFATARALYPESASLGVFEALTLHAQGKRDTALASLMELVADHVGTDEIKRYEASIRGNAEYLRGLEQA